MTNLQNFSKKAIAIALTMVMMLSLMMVAGTSKASALSVNGVTMPQTSKASIKVNKGDLVTYWVELTVPDAKATPIIAWLLDVKYNSSIFAVDADFANGKKLACGDAAVDYATGASKTEAPLPGGNQVIANFNNAGTVTIMDAIPMGSLGLEGKTTKLFCLRFKAIASGTGTIYTQMNDVTDDNIETVAISNSNFVQKYKVDAIGTPEVEVKSDAYYVSEVDGLFDLKLSSVGTGKLSAEMALQAGTYKIKLNNYGTLLGYTKTVTDATAAGLTCKASYAGHITFNATGGVYKFQVTKSTNTLVIKKMDTLPSHYLVGDVHTVLQPVEGRPLAVGSTYLEKGTYKIKVSANDVALGYGKSVTDKTSGSLTMKSTYGAYVTLTATGGTYTFTFNTKENKLQINHIPVQNEATNDVHISGDFKLVLNDNDGAYVNATGKVTLAEGAYSFKVYNYGTAYTAGVKITDEGSKDLKSTFTSPVTLIVSGGTYKFTFNKTTGNLTVEKQ